MENIGIEATVLVVDDLEDIGWIISKALTAKGYKVVLATSGSDALSKMKWAKPSILILDIRLPDISGIELLRLIRKMDIKVKCIIITAYPTTQLRQEAKELGACDFIPKPFNLEKLSRVVDLILHSNPSDN